MAFQQPQRHQPRPRSYSATSPEAAATPAPATLQTQQRQSPRQTPTDWIVFSPVAPSDSYDQTDSTVRTDNITGQVSDFDSLDTAAVSEKQRQSPARSPDNQRRHDRRTNQAEDEDAEDADSLDDGLHAFNEPSLGSDQRIAFNNQAGDTVLPAHDGLGMFPGNSSPVQEQFWQHEKYNPKRRQSFKRSSLQRRFEALEEHVDQISEDEKVQRIEKWRMEQSQAILEEIERETRRRRRRKSRSSASRHHKSPPAAASSPGQASTAPKPTSLPSQPPSQERLSFWERITRTVIRNLMGIDDATLEFIFGESLPADPQPQPTEKPSLASELIDHAERTISNDGMLAATTESWEQRLLARISKELGILLGHISEHPGAFTSYLRTQEPPPYAGLSSFASSTDKSALASSSASALASKTSAASAKFGPTLANQPRQQKNHHPRQSITTNDPSLWGIEEEDEDKPTPEQSKAFASPEQDALLQREREYWERDLDVKMVFGFLRDRFSSSTANDTPAPATQPDNRQYAQPRSPSRTNTTPLQLNTTTTASTLQTYSARNADSLRRAALIRHHHPLVSRNVENSQNQSRSRNFSPAVPLSPILGRRPSCAAETESYASQSTKRSKTAHSSSSRNFWDIGGSLGGGGSLGAASVSWGLV